MENAQREQFESRLLRYQSNLESFVRSLMPFAPIEDIRDVVQETNLAIIRHAPEYDPARPFLAWCFAFARMQVMKVRLETRRSRLVFDDELAAKIAEATLVENPTDAELAASDRLAALRICKSKLPPRHRELLDARYECEQSVNQIARATGSNPHTVTTTLAYIRSRLRECMDRLCRLNPSVDIPEPIASRDAVNQLIDSPRDSVQAFPNIMATLKESTHPDLLAYYIEQRQMDDLLSLGHPHPARARRRVSRWIPLAAGFAVLLGGIAYAFYSPRERTVPTLSLPVPAPVTAHMTVSAETTVPRATKAPTQAVAPISPPVVSSTLPVVSAAPTTHGTPVAAQPAAVVKGETNMVKTQAVAAVAAALTIVAKTALPLSESVSSGVSDNGDLDTRVSGDGVVERLDLEARDSSWIIKWNLNLLSTKAQGGAILLI